MKTERAFFERLANLGQADWTVKLQPHMVPGQMDLASYTARVYLVDTSTGWTAAGALQPSGFAAVARAQKDAGLTPDQVNDLAGQTISRLGRDQPGADAPEVAQAIQLTAAALAGTQTFKTVQPTGLDGHWIYIGYRMLDASTICRPGFFRTGAPGFADPDAITQFVRQVVAHDLGNAKSVTGQMLKRAGGAILAPQFK
jgi:hypothetical protein